MKNQFEIKLKERIEELQEKINDANEKIRLITLFDKEFGFENINDISIFPRKNNNSFMSIKTDEPIEVVSKLLNSKGTFYVKNNKLQDGYSNISKDGYDEVAPFKIDINNGDYAKTTFKLSIKFDEEIYFVHIDINNNKLYATHKKELVRSMGSCREDYTDSRLHSSILDIDGYKVQTWGSHAPGLHHYSVWFDNKDIDPLYVLKRLLEN